MSFQPELSRRPKDEDESPRRDLAWKYEKPYELTNSPSYLETFNVVISSGIEENLWAPSGAFFK